MFEINVSAAFLIMRSAAPKKKAGKIACRSENKYGSGIKKGLHQSIGGGYNNAYFQRGSDMLPFYVIKKFCFISDG